MSTWDYGLDGRAARVALVRDRGEDPGDRVVCSCGVLVEPEDVTDAGCVVCAPEPVSSLEFEGACSLCGRPCSVASGLCPKHMQEWIEAGRQS